MKDYKAQAAKSYADKMHRMTGGHADVKADRALVNKMVKPEARTGMADGGKAHKGKPKTQVNVMVAPRGDEARAVPVPVPGGQAPGPVTAMPSRPVAPAVVPQRPMPAGGLGGLQGGAPMAKKGGRVEKHARGGKVDGLSMVKGYDAGGASGPGRLEKTAEQKRKDRR